MTTAEILWITAFVVLGLLLAIGSVVAAATHRRSATHTEALLVVAVGGIGIAIALPAYQDFAMRARIEERLAAARGPKAAIEESLRRSGKPPSALAVAAPIGYDAATGSLTVALPGSAYEGKSLVLVPARADGGAVAWTCKAPPEPRALLKHIPAECR